MLCKTTLASGEIELAKETTWILLVSHTAIHYWPLSARGLGVEGAQGWVAQKTQARCHLLDFCHADALQDKLSHAVALVDLEVLATMVEQNNPNRPAVVVVHNSSANVDHLLHGQTGSRGDTRVRVGRDGDGEVRLDESLASGGDCGLVGTEERQNS